MRLKIKHRNISYQYLIFSIYTILYDVSLRFYCCKFWNLVLDPEFLKCCFYPFFVKRFWLAYVNSAIEVVILWRLFTFEYWLFYIEALGMSHTIALIASVSTIHQTTETMPLALNTIQTATRWNKHLSNSRLRAVKCRLHKKIITSLWSSEENTLNTA